MKKMNRFYRCAATCTHPQGFLFLKHSWPVFYQLAFVQLNKQFQTLLRLLAKQNRHDQHAARCVASTSVCLVGVSLTRHEYQGGSFSPPVLFKEIRTVEFYIVCLLNINDRKAIPPLHHLSALKNIASLQICIRMKKQKLPNRQPFIISAIIKDPKVCS